MDEGSIISTQEAARLRELVEGGIKIFLQRRDNGGSNGGLVPTSTELEQIVNSGLEHWKQWQKAEKMWAIIGQQAHIYRHGKKIGLQELPRDNALGIDNTYLVLAFMYESYKNILEGVVPKPSSVNFEVCKVALEQFEHSTDFARLKKGYPEILPALKHAYNTISRFLDLGNMHHAYSEIQQGGTPTINKQSIEVWRENVLWFMDSPIFLKLRLKRPEIEPNFVNSFKGVRDYAAGH